MTVKSSSDKSSRFMKKPHTLSKQFGSMNAELTFKIAKDLPNTTNAMSKIGKEEVNDDRNKAQGDDDYTSSLRELFNAFDTFIREFSKVKSPAGYRSVYNFSKDYELTIFLLWQIRNIWTHRGNVIDLQCKRKYEEAFNDAFNKGVTPIIDLPKKLEIDHEFTIDFKNYCIVREAIFKYIGERVSEEDLKILKVKASLKIDSFTGSAYMPMEFGILEIDIEEAIKCGCEFNYDEFKLYFPEGCKYGNQEIFTPDGKSFQARLLNPENPKDRMKLETFKKMGKPSISLSFAEKHKKFTRETFLTMEK